jgi:hypothetical protein
MSRSREYPQWARVVAASLQLFACTLSSDYQPLPLEVEAPEEEAPPAALQASPLPEATPPETLVEPAVSPDPEEPTSCADSSELPGCELSRAEPTPAASAECDADSDCASQNCSAGRCLAASCSDGILNQGESAADCGGPCSVGCAVGDACSSSRDCETGLSCPAATRRCAQPSCQDGLHNGSETGLDCGGACSGCAVGGACGSNADCASALCRDGTCASPSCDDLVRNQDETDIDCGGVCGPCNPGGSCGLDTDCTSGACEAGRCCGGQEVDCTRCARRLSTTLACTSNGASAETTAACNGFLQCLADNAATCPRRQSPGCSEAGGVCDIAHYGGSSAQGVALADGILGTAQCSF